MGQDLEIDRQVIRQAMAELTGSIDQLDRSRRSMTRLEAVSFGASDLGHRTQAQTEGAIDAVADTITSLREVHDQLVQALATMQAEADAADEAAAAQADHLRQVGAAGGAS
jgi:prefoldin subunit 5